MYSFAGLIQTGFCVGVAMITFELLCARRLGQQQMCLPCISYGQRLSVAIGMQKLAISKNARPSWPTVRYACCDCSKVYPKFFSYKKHTNIVHSVEIEHKRVKVDAQHKTLTIEDSVMKFEPMKMNENVNGANHQWFVCQTCQRHFETAEKFEVRIFLFSPFLNAICVRSEHQFIKKKNFSFKLQKHRPSNKGYSNDKKSMAVQCHICLKNFQTPSA